MCIIHVISALCLLCFHARVGTILPARVNPLHKTRVYPGGAIRSYYPLWAICGFYEFWVLKILGFQSDDRYKSVEMILYNQILTNLMVIVR